MVGIYRKVKQVLQLLQDMAPYIDRFAPGIGSLVGAGANIGETVADGVNNVYEDYHTARKSGEEYGFGEGLRSFARPTAKRMPTAVSKLTKSYGGLHPRLKLKEAEPLLDSIGSDDARSASYPERIEEI
jgi:hypothetical protein